jgi:hypothetical protein
MFLDHTNNIASLNCEFHCLCCHTRLHNPVQQITRVLALQEGLLAGTLTLAVLYTDKIYWMISEVVTVVPLRILFFWDMMLYQRVIGSWYSKATSYLICKGQQILGPTSPLMMRKLCCLETRAVESVHKTSGSNSNSSIL